MHDLALAVERLVARGHINALDYTPCQVVALDAMARENRRIELAENLSIAAMASRGESRDVNKRIKELLKDG